MKGTDNSPSSGRVRCVGRQSWRGRRSPCFQAPRRRRLRRASDPHARELAQALVGLAQTFVGEENRQASPLNSSNLTLQFEPMIKSEIEKTVSVTDPAKIEKIGVIVHGGLEALRDDMVEARVSALTQTFTVRELEGMLAARRGPSGEVFLRAAPEHFRAFYYVVSNEVDGPTPAPSEQNLALIHRILKARDFENIARQAWRVIMARATQALSNPAMAQAQEDEYAQLAVAAEVRFYAKSFSDDQLTELAAYFEGPIGRAEEERGPQLGSETTRLVSKLIERRFERMGEDACAAVACSAVQRTALDEQFAILREAMVPMMSNLGR